MLNCVVKFTARRIYSHERTPVPIEQEEARAPEPVMGNFGKEKILKYIGKI